MICIGKFGNYFFLAILGTIFSSITILLDCVSDFQVLPGLQFCTLYRIGIDWREARASGSFGFISTLYSGSIGIFDRHISLTLASLSLVISVDQFSGKFC